MNRLDSVTKPLMWFMALLLVTLVVACGGGGGSPLLGGGGSGVATPKVIAVAPLNAATAVPINATIITAQFNEPVAPITGTNFALTCAASCVNPTGAVTLDATKKIATFASAANLAPATLYTATVTGAKSLATGLAMAHPYVWHFTTGVTADTTKPQVTSTLPATTIPGPTLNVPTNTAISAVFTEAMAPATITGTSFTLTCAAPCVNPAGSVSYAVGSKTAVFTPSAILAANTTYTATITTAATDLAGNQLAGNQAALPAASNYVWTFTTAALVPPANITVTPPTKPVAGATSVCPSSTISATFTVPSGLKMDPLTVDATTVIVTGPGPAFTPVVATTVALDPTGKIVTFKPSVALTNGTTYTATIKGGNSGVKDLAIPANIMVSDYTWNFTAGPATGICQPPVNLGTASSFGIASTAGITNTVTAPITHIEGDTVLTGTPTCNAVAAPGGVGQPGFGLCGSNGSTPTINGSVITPTYPDTTTANAVMADLTTAFYSTCAPGVPSASCSLGGATNIPAGTTLGGPAGSALVVGTNLFYPGAYQSITSIMVTGDLTLDAQGNPDAVFIFQSSSTIGTAAGAAPPGAHTRILLVNGAKASNVWWQASSSATLDLYSEFQGNILAAYSITMKTGATSCGRLLAGAFGAGAFVFDSNVVSVPGQPFAPPAGYSTTCQ